MVSTLHSFISGSGTFIYHTFSALILLQRDLSPLTVVYVDRLVSNLSHRRVCQCGLAYEVLKPPLTFTRVRNSQTSISVCWCLEFRKLISICLCLEFWKHINCLEFCKHISICWCLEFWKLISICLCLEFWKLISIDWCLEFWKPISICWFMEVWNLYKFFKNIFACVFLLICYFLPL